jgi:integrase
VTESVDVRIYKVQTYDRPKPFYLRWKVGGRSFGQTFKYQAQADTHRSKLVTAARSGEPFDTETGEPVSWARQEVTDERTWYEFAVSYLDMKWPHAAANTRTSIAEALAVLTMGLVDDKPGRPDDAILRAALYGWAFNATARRHKPTSAVNSAIEWTKVASVPLRSLQTAATARLGLEAIARKLDGKAASAATFTRKRATFYNALEYAVELELLDFNALDRVKWRMPKKVEVVDPRVVANPAQVRKILAEVEMDRPAFAAFFGCLYFAAMRPAEAVSLTRNQCHLPAKGWGRLDLTATATRAGRAWTDTGAAHDVRGLKHRAAGDMRPVPIPPELVKLLRDHLAEHGTAADGRLFRGRRKESLLSESTYGPAWKRARTAALTEAQATSKLAERPYDLRHGGVSLWLGSGVNPAEVARRAGHSVEVLLRVYAKCIDGQHEAMNRRIEQALTDDDTSESELPENDAEGDEGKGESEAA